jgi:hypothetical protein
VKKKKLEIKNTRKKQQSKSTKTAIWDCLKYSRAAHQRPTGHIEEPHLLALVGPPIKLFRRHKLFHCCFPAQKREKIKRRRVKSPLFFSSKQACEDHLLCGVEWAEHTGQTSCSPRPPHARLPPAPQHRDEEEEEKKDKMVNSAPLMGRETHRAWRAKPGHRSPRVPA